MSTNKEHNMHFQGFAELLCNEEPLAHFLDNPVICSSGMRREIVDLIAQRAYDLVYHALYCNGVDARYWPGKPEQASDYYKRQITKATHDVPDLDEWPPS